MGLNMWVSVAPLSNTQFFYFGWWGISPTFFAWAQNFLYKQYNGTITRSCGSHMRKLIKHEQRNTKLWIPHARTHHAWTTKHVLVMMENYLEWCCFHVHMYVWWTQMKIKLARGFESSIEKTSKKIEAGNEDSNTLDSTCQVKDVVNCFMDSVWN
jgi:hypothetical protein